MDMHTSCSGKRLCHWTLHDEIPSYLASVAVAEYVCVRDTFNGIMGHIPIEIWVLPTDTLKARNSFVNLKNILHLYEDKFGPYRWEKVGYVAVDFSSGAMEHATNIAYPSLAINGNTSYEILYAHELSHHWFGDLITCSKAEEMWINEGWATFCEFLHDETFLGYDTYLTNKRSKLNSVLRYAHLDDGGYYALNNIPPSNTYGKSSYDKGSLVVLNLRTFLGDSLFYAVFKQFLADNPFKTVTSEQMRDYVAQHANPKAYDFFNSWVFTPGFPHFSVDSFSVAPHGADWQIIVYSQERLRGRTTYSTYAETEITLMDTLWNTFTSKIHLQQGFGVDTFITSVKPSVIYTDLYEKINDATTDQYKVLKSVNSYTFAQTFFIGQVTQISDSAFVRVVHNWVAPDSLATPIPGLIISHERYWDVQGIFPQNFVMKGKFNYSKTTTPAGGGMDCELMTNNIDSMVVLYRPDKHHDWQIIPHTKVGSAYTGYMVVDSLKQGEYTFGIKNWSLWNNTGENIQPNSKPLIIPNPTKNDCTIYYAFNSNSTIETINNQGVVIKQVKLNSETKSYILPFDNAQSGMYFIRITCPGKPSVTERVILIRN
jgi:aminopeptidase N